MEGPVFLRILKKYGQNLWIKAQFCCIDAKKIKMNAGNFHCFTNFKEFLLK